MHLLMNGGQVDAVEVEPQRACVDFSCHRLPVPLSPAKSKLIPKRLILDCYMQWPQGPDVLPFGRF
jgi:hypothetical protein